VNRLLPVRSRVQHRLRLLANVGAAVARTRYRHFGNHERLRLRVEPAIDCRHIQLKRLTQERIDVKFREQHRGHAGNDDDAEPARGAGDQSLASTVIKMKREGKRMKLKPGSQ
jgi:hypothetical protein